MFAKTMPLAFRIQGKRIHGLYLIHTHSVGNMEKTTALVTGGTSGIGLETAKALAKQNMRVIIGCRDRVKGEKVVGEITREVQGADIHLGPVLDLSQPDSIRMFAKEYKYPLHVLVNNAGVNKAMNDSYAGTIDEIVQVNYLGPFLLTLLMEDKLIKHAGLSGHGESNVPFHSRVVNVSSVTHRLSGLGNGVLKNESLSDMFMHDGDFLYAATKLANVFFTSYMSQRWKRSGVNIHSVAVDPGSVVTGIWKNSKWENFWLLKVLFAPASDGAQAVIHAATVNFDEEKNIDTNSVRRDMATLSRKCPNDYIDYGKTNKEYPDFRLYARGAFSWHTLTNVNKPGALRALLHAAIDWPLRNLSRGIFANSVVPVRANLAAYNANIVDKFFQASAKFVGYKQ
jgi:NAD(P)-dependent dehydrogenase (short-subunit alcohol dehydrogenase family)